MRNVMTVFAFTLRDNIRKKTFIISTVIVVLLIVAASSVPGIAESLKSKPGTGTGNVKKANLCYVIDENGLVPGAVDALNQGFDNIDFKAGDPARLDEYKNTIEKDKTVAALEILKGEAMPSLRFTVTDFMTGVPTDGIAEVVRQLVVNEALTKEGVPAETTRLALAEIPRVIIPAGKMDITGYALGIVLTMIVFFAIYFYGYGVAMSVASEKTSRVMETLIVSAKPSRILLGKCIAMGVLGLIQLSIFIIAAALGYTFLVPDNFTISGIPLALSSFTPISAIFILLYFLLGYSLFAMINSVCGATVSRAEDLQSAMMPSVLISMISFYAAYAVLFMPDLTVRRVISYIPFTSPFIMPFRVLNETVPAVDIVVSVMLLLVAIVIVAALSIRLYSASVLHYGQRLKLRDMFRLGT